MQTSITEKYFLLGLSTAVLIIVIAILYPFLTLFILAVSFSVVINPIYEWTKKHITKNNSAIASFITITLFLFILCLPLFFVGTVIFNQTQNAYSSIVSNGNTNLFIQKIDTSINRLIPEGFAFNTHEKIINLISFITNNIGSFFAYTLNTILMTMLTIFTMFFILKDGAKWRDSLIKILPLSEKNTKEILSNLKGSINRVLRGSFFVAIIQGILYWFGFLIAGVPNPALWGVVAGMASFIPSVGTSIVSIPAMLFLYFTGMPIHAFGLLIWSLSVVATIDNIISPYIIAEGTDVPSIFILFSILGGITIIGPIGILIGPLMLGLLYSVVTIYRKEIN